MSVLNRLVDDVRLLESAWEKGAFVSTGLGDLDDVLSVTDLAALIGGGLPLAAVRLWQDGGFRPAGALARPPSRRGRTDRQLADHRRVLEGLLAGGTVAVEELQRYRPQLAAFVLALAEETGYQVEATAFLTPARATGFKPHRDDVSFFLRQVHGAKRWRVWPRESGRLQDRPDPAVVAAGAPELDVLLKEGDCIYVPRGRVHLGETLDEPSIHLSFAVFQDTWGQTLTRLVESVLSAVEDPDDPVNELLPPRFSPLDRPARLAEQVEWLAGRLAERSWPEVDPSRARPASAPAGPGPLDLQQALDRRPDEVRADGE